MNASIIAVGYVRTSQDSDDAFSLSSQEDAIREYCDEQGINLAYLCEDTVTGKIIDRPGLNKARQLIRDGTVNAIICYDATRLARKVGIAEYILDEVFECDIQLHLVSWGTCVKNTTRDIKTFYDEAVYSHIERMKIVERLDRGKKNKLSQGKWLCQGIDKYGFQTVGSKKTQHLIIVDLEASVIRAIFALFLEGDRVPDIADKIQLAGFETPSKAKGFWRVRDVWSPAMIYAILRDEAYIGRFYANMHKQVILDSGKKSTRLTNKDERTLLYFEHLRIIDDDTFNTAQVLLDKGKSRFAPNPKNQYLMNTRITCGDCQSAIASSTTITRGKPYSYYTCGGDKNGRKNTNRRNKCGISIRCHAVDSIVYAFVIELLNEPDRVLLELQQKQQEQIATNSVALDNVATAQRVLNGIEQQIRDYAEMYTQRLITLSIFAEKKQELDAKVSAAKEIIAEYESAVSKKVLTNREIKQKIKEVHNLREELDYNGELDHARLKHAVLVFDINAVIGTYNDRVYVGISWYGNTVAYYADNQDVLSGQAMNSTLLRSRERYIIGTWYYWLD